MIRLDELGQGRGDSSSDNSSVNKRGQADGTSVKTNDVHIVRLFRRTCMLACSSCV